MVLVHPVLFSPVIFQRINISTLEGFQLNSARNYLNLKPILTGVVLKSLTESKFFHYT